MSDIALDRRIEILDSLGSDKCEACGGTKKRKQSHCSKCYFKLPKQMRQDLYKPFGNGYEEAFEASLVHLRAA